MRTKLIGSLKSVFLFTLLTLLPMEILAQESAPSPPPSTNIGDLGPLLEKNEKEEAVNEYGPAFVEMVQEYLRHSDSDSAIASFQRHSDSDSAIASFKRPALCNILALLRGKTLHGRNILARVADWRLIFPRCKIG